MKTIKRYPNRKLYDTDQSRYITLEEIATFLRDGGEVHVVDSRTGEDMTAVTLAQVLLGEEKRSKPAVPIQRLIGLLQSGGEYLQKKIATPVTSLKGEAEKTVHRLIGEPAEELREFVVTTHKAYDEVQRRVDERLQMVLATMRNLNPVLKDVDRLKSEVDSLRNRVTALEAKGRGKQDG
jgi:polyhydroxyalkanoate synthesis repressor PhaR